MITFLHLVAFAVPALQEPPKPTPTPVPAPKPQEEAKPPWYDRPVEVAFVDAKAQSKLVMVFMTSELNFDCEKMLLTFSNDEVVAALDGVLCVKNDMDKDRGLAARHTVKDAPAILWFNPDGSVRDRVDGYRDRSALLADISRIKLDIGTIDDLRRKVAAKGDDLDARYELHKRLKSIGDATGAAAQKAAIERADPQGKSRGMHYFKYEKIMADITEYWNTHGGTLDMKRVGDLQAFLEVETEPWILWDGWMSLANTHEWLGKLAANAGKLDEAAKERSIRRDFLARAWRGIPEETDLLHTWCFTYSGLLWEQREELSEADKSFFLRLTARTVQLFDGEAMAHDLRARALLVAGKKAEA